MEESKQETQFEENKSSFEEEYVQEINTLFRHFQSDSKKIKNGNRAHAVLDQIFEKQLKTIQSNFQSLDEQQKKLMQKHHATDKLKTICATYSEEEAAESELVTIHKTNRHTHVVEKELFKSMIDNQIAQGLFWFELPFQITSTNNSNITFKVKKINFNINCPNELKKGLCRGTINISKNTTNQSYIQYIDQKKESLLSSMGMYFHCSGNMCAKRHGSELRFSFLKSIGIGRNKSFNDIKHLIEKKLKKNAMQYTRTNISNNNIQVIDFTIRFTNVTEIFDCKLFKEPKDKIICNHDNELYDFDCCRKCHAIPYHEGITCIQHINQINALDNDMDELRTNNITRCPNCFILVEKSDENCDKMTCTSCFQNFCWVCLTKLQKDTPYSSHLVIENDTYVCPNRSTENMQSF
jgi:hypothetical protein